MANARLLHFISEQEVEEINKNRTDSRQTETTVPERPLFEILKENKDKQQAEFNERFKHQPPKALDEDETEFLENLDKYQKEQELLAANEEAQQILKFQLAVANRTTMTKESIPSFHQTKVDYLPEKEKRPDPVKSILSKIRIKPQVKKAKTENNTLSESVPQPKEINLRATKSDEKNHKVTSLVAYGTDSDEDNE